MKEKVLNSVFQAIEEVNASLPPEKRIGRDPTAALYGPGGVIDSLELTILIVAVEQKIEEHFSQVLSLIDNKTTSEESPYRSVGLLAEHIVKLLEKS